MSITLALLLLCTICVSAVSFTHEFADNDLVSGCRFELGGNDYDLCPLIYSESSGSAEHEGLEYVWTGGAAVDRSYTITLGGMGRDRQCLEGTWICMTSTTVLLGTPESFTISSAETHGDVNTTQHEAQTRAAIHIPIAGKSRPDSFLVDQGINAIASVLSADDYPATPHVNIFFIGGFRQGRAQYARVDLVCDLNAKHGAPFFVEELYDVHIFTWITQHSCPVHRKISILKTELNSEDERNDLLDKKPSLMTFRRAMIFFFVAIGPILVALFIILIWPRSRQTFFVKMNSGRKGTEKGLDKHIPLNPASGKNSNDYGSATSRR